MAAALGVSISEPGLAKRFTFSGAAFLERLLLRACQKAFTSDFTPDVFTRFAAVFLVDSSVVMLPKVLRDHWPGCGGSRGGNAGLKLHAGLDLKSGLLSLQLSPAKAHDQTSDVATHPLAPESLRIADLGYYSFKQLQAYDAQGVWWLTRFKADGVWWDEAGQRVCLPTALAATTADHVEWRGYLGTARIPACLFAYRVSHAQAVAREAKLLHHSQRKMKVVSAKRLKLVGWTLLVTNAPSLRAEEALALYRVRWQIELLFKLWKQEGKVTTWRSANPARILCEVYAKLLGVLIQHWAGLGAWWAEMRRSLVKASRVVRSHTLWLACAVNRRTGVAEVLAQIQGCLRGCRVNTRGKAPATWQTLQCLITGLS